MIKKYGDIISSAVLLVCTCIYYSATFALNTKSIGGNALIPRMVSYILGACCIYLLATSGIKLYKEGKSQLAENTIITDETPSGYAKVILTVVLIALYAALFPLAGFVVSTPLYLTAQIYLLTPKDKRKILPPLLLAVGFSVLIYVIFTYVFLLLLPTGSIW